MRTLVAATARGRLATAMVAILAGLAVALGVAGSWGVVSFSARSRRHELAVRSALGASRGALVRAAARAGLAPAAAGLVVGFALALAAARLLASELYGLQPWEPLPLAGAAIVLLAASGTALLTPARRLSRVDPVSVLRGDGWAAERSGLGRPGPAARAVVGSNGGHVQQAGRVSGPCADALRTHGSGRPSSYGYAAELAAPPARAAPAGTRPGRTAGGRSHRRERRDRGSGVSDDRSGRH